LPAACQLFARALPALRYFTHDLAGALACLTRCGCGRREGAFDRRAERVSDSCVVAFRALGWLLGSHEGSLRFRHRLNGGAMRTYLDPTAPIAPDAVLVDDPKVAMDLAVATCESPRMSNLSHGLWGYHGSTPSGPDLTIQSLGIGGPSAAVVMADLAKLGVRRAIRIGYCIAQDASLERSSSLVVTCFEPGDGASAAISGGAGLSPDPQLTQALLQAAGDAATGTVRSVDVLEAAGSSGGDAVAHDLSSAAFAAAAARDGIAGACALVVAGQRGGAALGLDALNEALIGLGTRAAAALGAVPQASG
jgi:hypothetical protein